MVQLRAGDGSVFFTIAGLLIFALILSTGVAFLFAFVFRFRWIEPRYFTDYSKFRWIWWGVLAGIPNGFLLRWRQQADTPFEAAFATTGSFIGFFVILGITFWLVFRVFIYSKPR
jgi:hypothetical protein